MSLPLSCEAAAGLLSAREERPLPLGSYLRLQLHLLTCAPCRILRVTLRTLPELLGRAPTVEDGFEALGRAALKQAMARLALPRTTRAWPATPVPHQAARLLEAGADLPLRILASTHAILAGERGRPEGSLPQAILDQLPPEAQWVWKTDLDGLRKAELLADPSGGQRLFLVHAPPGSQVAPHRRLGSESLLILSGSLEERGLTWEARVWLHYDRGVSRALRIPPSGCWFLLRKEGPMRFQSPGRRPRTGHAAS